MSELTLTILRFAFLGLLWAFVLFTVWALRKDLRAPADAKPSGVVAAPPRENRKREERAAKAAKKSAKDAGRKVKGMRLVVIEGPLAGTVIPLEGSPITLGRAPDSTIVIDDDYASSRHARIFPADGTWMIEDLGSTNGTWISRNRITSAVALKAGEPVRVGRTTLQMEK